MMMAHPLALQLRNLQSLVEIGVDKNTTVVFPAPLMSTIAELGDFLAREKTAAVAAARPVVDPRPAHGPARAPRRSATGHTPHRVTRVDRHVAASARRRPGHDRPHAAARGAARAMDAYWRAANYLSVGQIYLYDNPLLRRPLALSDVKPLVVGHWGTTPGQNFIYVHLNRVIKKYDLDMFYVAGPGHGGPGAGRQHLLEGTYSEIYPDVSQDEAGLKKLFTQFSFPGGISSQSHRRRRGRSTRAVSSATR